MSALSKILRDVEGGGLMFHCPGCGHNHIVWVGEGKDRPRWGWNSNVERPTFTPSLLVTWNQGEPPVTPENLAEYKKNPWPQTKVPKTCHSFITDGRIQFLGDCTHALAGQTVPIPDFD